MHGGAQVPGAGPPAEVHVYVLPPVGHGSYSLMCYPRRLGDTTIYFTTQGNHPTNGRAREIVWIPHGLGAGQQLTIREKGWSPGKGNFQAIAPIHAPTPFQHSGPPVRGPHPHRSVTWAYDVILSDANEVLAVCDPVVVIIEDP